MKNLLQLLENISYIHAVNIVDREILALEFDSRKIQNQTMFFAIKGVALDGHQYINLAIEKGATCVVCETIPEKILENITYIQVDNSQKTLGSIAANFYGNPSENLQLIGITGTNGKTSTTTLLFDFFTQIGYKCALISTVENRIHTEIIPSTHTTPDAITLNQLLAKAVTIGCEYAFMEVSSHGIHQNRLEGLHFKIAGFTNITHDHLDYHKTFIDYIKVKKLFFDTLPKSAVAVTNIDDKNGLIMLQNTPAKKYSYALKTTAHFKAKILESRIDGMLLSIQNKEVWTSLSGEFNAYNLLLVYAIAHILGINEEDILVNISKIQNVKGRFETFTSDTGITIIIDYAHTPDALENILNAINQIRTKNETVFTLFGCGGNRDKEKRPEMAKIACTKADKVIITSDNPRNENPQDIISEIEKGIPSQYYYKSISIANRKEALKYAIEQAKTNDIILIAGKGHENYQEINGVKHHFDDKEEVLKILKLLRV